MAPALSVRYMVTTLLEVNRIVVRTEVDVLEVTVDFLEDKITKTEVAPFKQPSPPNTSPCNQHHRRRRLPSHPPPPYRPLPQLIAGLIQAAGRPACKRALTVLGPQINYILHGDPLAEPHDYADPKYVGCEARHCMTADDLRKIDDGRAAEWTAAQSSKFTAKVAPISATRPRPRPDLALTLSLSPRAYAYHIFARTLYTLALSAALFLRRPVAAPALPINATGTSITWKSAEANVGGGVSRDRVARPRGAAQSGPRRAVPGLRAVPRTASPVLQSLEDRQAGPRRPFNPTCRQQAGPRR